MITVCFECVLFNQRRNYTKTEWSIFDLNKLRVIIIESDKQIDSSRIDSDRVKIQTLNMKSKKKFFHLIESFLKKSPRSAAQRRNCIVPPQYRDNLSRLPTDQQYINNFIVHIDCSYMYNYYGPPTTNQQKIYLHKKSFANPMSSGLVRRKIIEINDQTMQKKQILFQLIKTLNKDKQAILKYTEMQEFLTNLTLQQTRIYKKVIVFFYKWLLNQKHNFPQNSIYQELCQELSELVIKKIYDSHQKGDYQILKNTQEELYLIQNLEKAREQKKLGKLYQAKQTYQLVYFGRVTDESDRIEALQFICQRSKQQKDTSMLQRMILKIKEGQGIRVHEKTLSRTINQIYEVVKTSSNHDQILLNSLMTHQQGIKVSQNNIISENNEKKLNETKLKELFTQEKENLLKKSSRKVKILGGTLVDEDELL